MTQSLRFLSLALLAAFVASPLVHADGRAAKGSCTVNDQRIVLERVAGEHKWDSYFEADLGKGVQAKVTFSLGYGMTFVHLGLWEAGQKTTESTMWISGYVDADSTIDDAPKNTMERFNALSLTSRTAVGKVLCGYNFYGERSGG